MQNDNKPTDARDGFLAWSTEKKAAHEKYVDTNKNKGNALDEELKRSHLPGTSLSQTRSQCLRNKVNVGTGFLLLMAAGSIAMDTRQLYGGLAIDYVMIGILMYRLCLMSLG